LVAAAFAGILTGGWLINRNNNAEKLMNLDEYVGLAQRTGLTGELSLSLNPVEIAINPSEPLRLNLSLTNSGSKSLVLNNWLTPAPAELRSNQLPFKVIVTRDGHPIHYNGTMSVLPPHRSNDFLILKPGQSQSIPMEISRGTGGRGWNMSVPGSYRVEVWYETYLTGKYIGMKAWSGMTNHVVAQVTVGPTGR
jgi:hypothetical protein